MTLTLDLTPEVEQQLIERSSQLGLTANQYAMRLLQTQLSPTKSDSTPTRRKLSREEFVARLNAFGVPCDVVLSDEAISRQGLYE